MTDLFLVAVLLGCFALSVAFVRVCERIIGLDAETEMRPEATDERIAA